MADYNFRDYKKDSLTRPRDLAWTNWAKFDKVGDMVQGYIRDAFYRPAQGIFKEHRGITLETPEGKLINVGIKRHDFILAKTDNLRVGDPLSIELIELKANKGLNDTKIFGYYGKNIEDSEGNATVKELDDADRLAGGTSEAAAAEPVEPKDDEPADN